MTNDSHPFIILVDQILTAKKQHTPLSPLDRGEIEDRHIICGQRAIRLIAIVEGKR